MTDMIRSTSSSVVRWAALAVAAAFVAGCKDVSTPAERPGETGGTMVVASPAELGSVLPLLADASQDREITDLLYDKLAEIGDEMNTVGDKGFKPRLAERWEWAPDSLSIVLHIAPKARWHDGQPVRASDVRYSFALAKDPALGAQATPLIANIDSVSVRDSVTAVAWFKRHTPEQFYDLAYQVAIVPEHVLSNTPAAQMKTAEAARRGIGSGRFRLARWVPGQRAELVADTLNYRGRPKLDRIIYTFAPDFTTAVTRFFTREADLFEVLRPQDLEQMKSDTVHRVVRYPVMQYSYLAMNLVDPAHPGQPHPIFGERAVRRALTMAVDRRAMLRNVFDTLGQMSYGPFPRSIGVADTTLAQLPFDTVKARALLDSAGWVAGPGGVRAKNGRKLEFAILTPNSSAVRKKYAVLLQDAFRRIGAMARVDEADYPTFASKTGARTFDTELAAFGTDPSVSGSKQSWATEGIRANGFNWTSYSNPVVDAMLDSATSAFDPARTRSYARRAFEAIIEDAPGIWLYEPLTMAGIDKRIHTTSMRADGYWSGMADWNIPPAQRIARDKIGLRATP
jgi:peptide/nickel transport system substrate-binding protein